MALPHQPQQNLIPFYLIHSFLVALTTKKTQILDGFKPSRNLKKPSGNNPKRFIMDGLKPSRIKCREMNFQMVWAKPSRIDSGRFPPPTFYFFIFFINIYYYH
jgi:hypothetical protein